MSITNKIHTSYRTYLPNNIVLSVLGVILILSAALRLWHLDRVPPSLSLDEVSLGYNAHSILKTGADEYGYRFPLLLRAYDDWRPALYAYFVVPFVAVLGLTPVAVRLPAAIMGIAAVAGTYFLVKGLLTVTAKDKGIEFKTETIALCAALLLAISPWHVYLSRLGHEANSGLTFFLFGVLFLLRRRYMSAGLLYALSLMSYQSEKIVLPAFLIGYALWNWRTVWQDKKSAFIGIVISLIVMAPFIAASVQPDALVRFRATNIFQAEAPRLEEHATAYLSARESGDMIGRLFHSRYIVMGRIVLKQYVSHFNPVWLFSNRGAEPHKVPRMGLLARWEIPLVAVGLFILLVRKSYHRFTLFIALWLLSAPIAAALTTDAPHAMRAYTMLPAWQIIGGIGAWHTVRFVTSKKPIMAGFMALISVIGIIALAKNYFVLFPREQSDSFQYALTQAVAYVEQNKSTYNTIVISNEDNLYQSYMFYLFHTSYSPDRYHAGGGTISGGYAETHTIDHVQFRPVNWTEDQYIYNTMFIGNPTDFPEDRSFTEEFRNLDGSAGVVSYVNQ